MVIPGKSASGKVFAEFNDAADEMKGKATVCSVDCRFVIVSIHQHIVCRPTTTTTTATTTTTTAAAAAAASYYY